MDHTDEYLIHVITHHEDWKKQIQKFKEWCWSVDWFALAVQNKIELKDKYKEATTFETLIRIQNLIIMQLKPASALTYYNNPNLE